MHSDQIVKQKITVCSNTSPDSTTRSSPCLLKCVMRFCEVEFLWRNIWCLSHRHLPILSPSSPMEYPNLVHHSVTGLSVNPSLYFSIIIISFTALVLHDWMGLNANWVIIMWSVKIPIWFLRTRSHMRKVNMHLITMLLIIITSSSSSKLGWKNVRDWY